MTPGRPPVPEGRAGRRALVAWFAFLAVVVAVLHSTGGALAPPPVTTPGRVPGWLDGRPPAAAAVAVVRLLALGTGWYLLAATSAALGARLVGWRSLIRATDAVAVPVVRRLVHGAIGVSLAALPGTGVAGPALADPAGPPGAVVTMRRLPGPPGPVPSDPVVPAAGPVPGMRRAAPGAATPTSGPGTPAEAPPAVGRAAPGATAGEGGPGRSTWLVRPGEHFWGIAERVLAAAWSRPPGDGEVDGYWRALVEANAAVLVDPGNPDLLFPGQVLTLPPATGGPGG